MDVGGGPMPFTCKQIEMLLAACELVEVMAWFFHCHFVMLEISVKRWYNVKCTLLFHKHALLNWEYTDLCGYL